MPDVRKGFLVDAKGGIHPACDENGWCLECGLKVTWVEPRRQLREDDTIEKLMLQALGDPGSFTPRGDDYSEPIINWQQRAVKLALLTIPVAERMEYVGMVPVPTAEEAEANRQNWRVGFNRTVKVSRDCACFVGLCGLHGRPHEQANRPMVWMEAE